MSVPLANGRSVDTVAVIGAGVIGSSWAALFLSRGLTVVAHDPDPLARERLTESIHGAWPALTALGGPTEPDFALLEWRADLAEAVHDADFVQESGPESLPRKRELVAVIDAAAPATTVIASSSSGLTPSDLQSRCSTHPERVLIGHPFHPAHLIPLVEVVGGRATSAAAIDGAMSFYTELRKRPIQVRQELAGHVVNRLQAALWREAYSLVSRGVVTVEDLDAAITSGPGLRWAAIGPLAGQHLSGGASGMAHTLEHLGPPMVGWWEDLGSPVLDDALIATLVEGTTQELAGTSSTAVAAARDRVVLAVLAARALEPDLP
jgi:3-hydroxyacyl-CoA dehydrogenase